MDKLAQICEGTTKHVTNLDYENVGSGFSSCFNPVPKTRCFKMAFLNIVSLPKKIDEIQLSMSNKHIDFYYH